MTDVPCFAARSPHWAAVEKAHLEKQPECQVCGKRHGHGEEIDVHHKQPFHLCPARELDEANLITLCRPHHLLFGHLMDWRDYNRAVEADCATWRKKIGARD